MVYYYRFSPGMQGGDLEFISRRPRKDEFWLYGGCGSDSLTPEEAKQFVDELPHCRVPMQQGTLAVFSNYQLVHRVLTMKNSTDSIVLFIVDQKAPLESTLCLTQDRFPIADKDTRSSLFFEQLKPQGQFTAYDNVVYSTGNGCLALLGWMEKNLKPSDVESKNDSDRSGLKVLQAMSKQPPLGRGLSWAMQEENWDDAEEQEDEEID